MPQERNLMCGKHETEGKDKLKDAGKEIHYCQCHSNEDEKRVCQCETSE